MKTSHEVPHLAQPVLPQLQSKAAKVGLHHRGSEMPVIFDRNENPTDVKTSEMYSIAFRDSQNMSEIVRKDSRTGSPWLAGSNSESAACSKAAAAGGAGQPTDS